MSSIIKINNIVIDTISERQWLDLAETQNQSINQVNERLNNDLLGWQYAEVSDVAELFDNAGLIRGGPDCEPDWQDKYCGFNPMNNGLTAEFIQTITSAPTFADLNGGPGQLIFVSGYTKTRFETLRPEFGMLGITGNSTVHLNDFFPEMTRTGDANINTHFNYIDDLNFAIPWYGSYLFRESTVVSVSEPNIMIIIFGVVIWISLKKHFNRRLIKNYMFFAINSN